MSSPPYYIRQIRSVSLDLVRMSGHELTVLAMGRLAATGPTDLAKKLGLRGYGQAPVKRVERWLKPDGDNPDYEGTVKLLEALGVLNWDVLNVPPGSVEAAEGRADKKTDQVRGQVVKLTTDPPQQAEEGGHP